MNRLRSWLLHNRDEFIAELLGLPLQFGLEAFLAFGVPCGPDRLVVFDLMLHHRVEPNRDFVGGSRGGRCRPDFALHPAEIISHWGLAMMQRIGGESKQAPSSIIHLSHASPQHLSPTNIVVRTQCY